MADTNRHGDDPDPATEFDTGPTGETTEVGMAEVDREAMADREADRYADAFWGRGL